MKSRKPLIGITMDYPQNTLYSLYPWHALRENYASCISQYNGLPIPITYDMQSLDQYTEMLDGLLVTGGDFDIDPVHYGEKISSPNVNTIPKRTEFEFAIFECMYKANKPILGICGGMQLLNVALGGDLIQDISSQISGASEHQQPNPRHQTSHDVIITHNSLLWDICGTDQFKVNSAHHQAVRNCGKNVIACAYAQDGIIEAIACNQHIFCVGLQWHPEFFCTQYDRLIIKGFIDACRTHP